MPPKQKKAPTELTTNVSASLSGPRVIYWFRTDLRIHDSPALTAALALQPSALFPIWTWDPHYVYHARVGPNRWSFLTDCQRDLSASLTKLNQKQKLWLIREAPQSVFPKLFKLWGITHLVFEKDTDAYARQRDEAVMRIAKECGVEVIVEMGRNLYDPDELVLRNGGKPTMSMAQVLKACTKINGDGQPKRPLAPPTSLPDPGDMDLSSIDHEIPQPERDFNAAHRDSNAEETQYASIMGPAKDFSIPNLEEMGIDPASATTPHRGGETIALQMLATYCADSSYIGTFEKPKTAPSAFSPQSTTLLSPHLHFGSLSVRKFWWNVADVVDARKRDKKHVSDIPVNLPGQLLFRDMYFGAQAALGYSFAQTQGNKVARWVDWHLQSNYSAAPVGEHLLDGTYNIDWAPAEEWFQRWKHGRTGFPWIDALMRQLKQEGWIHHLGRHSVACFLTRGGCYVSWERGAEVFEEWLIDHETACNVGNWMWLSCTAFFSQFYRCYSPVAFGKKWDPEGAFVRKYVPELERFDKKYIYEPHLAPIADQKRWGCLIKGAATEADAATAAGGLNTYPKPMFDFAQRREICLNGMKKAYALKMYGDDAKVLDGNWKTIFEYDDDDDDRDAALKDETNGIAERPKKRQKRDRDDDDGDQQPGENAGHEPPDPDPPENGLNAAEPKAEPRGKKQGTLDAHFGKGRAKR